MRVGTVREIGLFRTEIVTDDGNYVSIPNATIFSGTIVNIFARGAPGAPTSRSKSTAAKISTRCRRPSWNAWRASRGC